MTRCDIALIFILTFLAVCWVASLIVRAPTRKPPPLAVFELTDKYLTAWFVASSAAAATAAFRARWEEQEEEEPPPRVRKLAADEVLTFSPNDDDDNDSDGNDISMTAAKWVETRGPGLVTTTEGS